MDYNVYMVKFGDGVGTRRSEGFGTSGLVKREDGADTEG
jgi:hypothetical protein